MLYVSAAYLAAWQSRVSDLQLEVQNVTKGTTIPALDFNIDRARDFRLVYCLAGSAYVRSIGEFDSVDDNDEVRVRAGFNNELVTIYTGFVDSVSHSAKNNTISIKMRDRLKYYARKTISPNELIGSSVKSILETISDLCGIDSTMRDFDDVSIYVDYWAPKDIKGLDEIRKILEATVESDLYAEEDGTVRFVSHLPSTKQYERWNSGVDWTTKQTSSAKMTAVGNQLTCVPDTVDDVDTATDFYGSGHGFADYVTYTLSFGVQYTERRLLDGFTVNSKYTFTATGGVWDTVTLEIQADGAIVYSLVDDADLINAMSAAAPLTKVFSALGIVGQRFLVTITAGKAVPFLDHTLIISKKNLVSMTAGSIYANADHLYWLHAGSISHQVTGLTAGIESFMVSIPTACSYESSNIGAAPSTFDVLEVIDNDSAFSYYGMSSADGSTWSAPVPLTKNDIITLPLTNYYRWGVTITTRLPDTIDSVQFTWWVGGGYDRYSKAVSFTLTDGEIVDIQRVKTDEIGGENALVNAVNVKSQPKYAAAVADVWQGTSGGQPVTAGNPLVIGAGDVPYVILADLGSLKVKESTQVLVCTGAAATLTAHATKPTITITGAGTITDLRITGSEIVEDASIEVTAQDAPSILLYGEAQVTVDNEYINTTPIAEAIANQYIDRFRDPREIIDVRCKFTPFVQMGDMVLVNSDKYSSTMKCWVMAVNHAYTGQDMTFDVSTSMKMLVVETYPRPVDYLVVYVKYYADDNEFQTTSLPHELGCVTADGGAQLWYHKESGECVLAALPDHAVAPSLTAKVLTLSSVSAWGVSGHRYEVAELYQEDGTADTQGMYIAESGDLTAFT